ncbi:hypothetical protein PHYPSEUDO_013920 [Phytophthora pseudosyringae]|uniref:RWP-RK domain-containing protein n=1 Tax=Phytophthora pseudosyringae TaxID=221518 RepID=A0A8T1V9L3_9STRA|nr:hypothetical protein PHYPSEUDO_013920 [Phytophthora pseudosyringae]
MPAIAVAGLMLPDNLRIHEQVSVDQLGSRWTPPYSSQVKRALPRAQLATSHFRTCSLVRTTTTTANSWQMLQHSDSLAPLNLQLVSSLEDVYMQSPSALGDGQAARAHAARKSAFLSMSPACNFEAFSLHFHLPLKVAAEKFGVRATAFKKRCRAIGIRHWPYRKVRSLKRSLQELRRCQEQAPLSDKQQAQYATFKRQLDKLMAPETYGLDPSGRLGPQYRQQLLLASDDDDEDAESEDGTDSLASQSPRLDNELSFYDCTVSPTDRDAKSLGDVIPAGSTHLRIRRSQVMHLPPAHLSFFDRGLKSEPMTRDQLSDAYYAQQQFYSHFDGFAQPSSVEKAAADLIFKASPTSHKKSFLQSDDYPPSGFDCADLDFLPLETKFTDVRSLNDADEEFTAHASQVDYSSERFFDDVFLQISPDYGCLV